MNKNIEIYLHNAFRELEAFAIPDVGTFRKVYRAAEYEVHAGTVKPPVVDIEFSQEVSHRLLLTHYLINNVHLSQREADRIVKHISLTVSASINETGKYEINQVGSLLKDPEGQIYFRSVDRRNNLFSADFYGLQPLYLESTPNEQPQEEDPHANTMNDQPIQEPKPSGQRLNFLSLTLIASFFVLVALVYVSDPVPTLVSGENFSQSPEELIAQSSPSVISDDKTNQEDLSTEFRGITEPAGSDAQQLENVGLATPAAPEEKVQAPVRKSTPVTREMLAENTPSTTFEEERVTVTENEGVYRGGMDERSVMRSIDESSLSNTNTSLSDLDSLSLGESRGVDNMVEKSIPVIKYYHLIAGSFGTQGAAIDFAKSLEKEGYSPIVLYPKVNNSSNYRVSIYRSASIDQVKTYNSKLKKLGKQTGWIYEQLEER
ncbi:MAG: SPOR domain-containing protein [Bacteroidota bacterium]